MGSFFCFRLATVVVSAALMTLATSPMQLTNGLERLFNPAKRIGLPVAELALMISITLRFIPVLVDEAERLRKAQVARGAEFGGHPLRRARSLLPLLIPLFVSAFERADRLAPAMESRGYQPGLPRTYYHRGPAFFAKRRSLRRHCYRVYHRSHLLGSVEYACDSSSYRA